MSWFDDDDDEERWFSEWEIPLERGRCDWCGRVNCNCDDALFDADELGLDPEDDRDDERGESREK